MNYFLWHICAYLLWIHWTTKSLASFLYCLRYTHVRWGVLAQEYYYTVFSETRRAWEASFGKKPLNNIPVPEPSSYMCVYSKTLIWGWLRCPSHLKMPLKNIKTHEERVQSRTKYFCSGLFGSVKSSFRKIENLQIPFRSAFIITEQSFITCRWLAWMLCDVVKQKVSLLHNWYIKGGVRWVLKQQMEKLRFIWKSFNAKNRLLILSLSPGHLQSVDWFLATFAIKSECYQRSNIWWQQVKNQFRSYSYVR